MELTTILAIFFIAAIALLLGGVLLGSVATSIDNAITDNETKAGFEKVDEMGAQSFSLMGAIGLPLIICGGFVIIIIAWKR